ncbi:MAG: tRNA-dihydrouridine synthase A [Cellvibrionaceae bacterium]|jgi:tRNA-dihydrouridine synthase A
MAIYKQTSRQAVVHKLKNRHRFCVAPMMDWSDRHCRYLWRLISQRALLYTEMISTNALLHGDRERLLGYHPQEHPLALQLGGNDPQDLAKCARLAEEWGYDEVNLNCGCPSNRVQNGMIGACLMSKPHLVRDCLSAMGEVVSIPITIKQRIGIDDMDSYVALENFVGIVSESGCETFIVHARKAFLNGLSPKANREVPPLVYESVYRLKKAFPQLTIVINGGIHNLEACEQQLKYVDGVMVGRQAYNDPYLLAEVDQKFYGQSTPVKSRKQIFKEYMSYCDEQLHRGIHLNHMSRHVLHLFQGKTGARAFRRIISENAYKRTADIGVLEYAFKQIT